MARWRRIVLAAAVALLVVLCARYRQLGQEKYTAGGPVLFQEARGRVLTKGALPPWAPSQAGSQTQSEAIDTMYALLLGTPDGGPVPFRYSPARPASQAMRLHMELEPPNAATPTLLLEGPLAVVPWGVGLRPRLTRRSPLVPEPGVTGASNTYETLASLVRSRVPLVHH